MVTLVLFELFGNKIGLKVYPFNKIGLKVNGYSFRGNNSAIFIFVTLSDGAEFVPRSKFFDPVALRMAKTLWRFDHSECNRVKSSLYFGRVLSCRKANTKSHKLCLFVKMAQKIGRLFVHLRLCTYFTKRFIQPVFRGACAMPSLIIMCTVIPDSPSGLKWGGRVV